MFYGRLFEIAPAVKPLFRGDMKEQGSKLMATLAVVVNGLGNLQADTAGGERARQASRGVRSKAGRLRAGGRGAVWTLERGLGEQWTPELAPAWGAAYAMLVQFMIDEAYGRSVAAE